MINVKQDIQPVIDNLNFLFRDQVPYATARALTEMAKLTQKELKRVAPNQIDRPTAFTLRAFKYYSATKRRPEAAVYIEPIQEQYLQHIISGGPRYPKGGRTAIPANIALNRYGNIPGRKRGIIRNKRQFIANINGLLGIWERAPRVKTRTKTGRKRKLKAEHVATNKANHDKVILIAKIKSKVDYEKSFKYFEQTEKFVRDNIARLFKKELEKAIASAK